MSTTITTAFAQYANRPRDERYPSVAAMIQAATDEKAQSVERTINVKDLRIEPMPDGSDVAIVSSKGMAKFSNWSFGQFSRSVGAPASYLRSLPPELVARNLNHGIATTSGDLNLLVRGGGDVPIIRAATTDSYGRVWDSQLYGMAKDQIFSNKTTNGEWMLPPTWSGEPAGAYRGDRDSFLIQVDGGSIVENPSHGTGSSNGGRPMFRGLLISNSEVGKSSVVIDCVLFDYVCGNHNLWGAVIDQSFRRRHVGTKVLRDTIREIGRIAQAWTNHSAEKDAAIVRGLIEHEIATSQAAVVDELRKMGATKEQAEHAYATCEQKESVSPRSFWGIASGLTRDSQTSGYQSDRYDLDQLAAKVLKAGSRQLVAA